MTEIERLEKRLETLRNKESKAHWKKTMKGSHYNPCTVCGAPLNPSEIRSGKCVGC